MEMETSALETATAIIPSRQLHPSATARGVPVKTTAVAARGIAMREPGGAGLAAVVLREAIASSDKIAARASATPSVISVCRCPGLAVNRKLLVQAEQNAAH